MGGILSGASNAKQQKAVGSLQFQTSQQGGVIPLVYGTTRVSPNLIDYDDFKATPSARQGGAGKGGGGGKGGGQQYKYSASVIMGLCQGPIAGIGTVWWDKNVGTLSSLPAAVYLGSDGQAADPYWETSHADKALGYSGTATVVANNFAMGNTATLPNFSFEVQGLLSLSGTNGFDANPAAIVSDFLTNPRYGAGFPVANLGDLSLYSAYCQALGLVLSPMLDTQQEAQQHLADIVKLTNSAIVWSGGLLKIIPYGDQPVTGNGAAYAPDTTPLYSLGEDDFIVQESSVGTSSGVSPGGPALRSGSGPITGGFSDDPVHSHAVDARGRHQLDPTGMSGPIEQLQHGDSRGLRSGGDRPLRRAPRQLAEGAGDRRSAQCRPDRGPASAAARIAVPQYLSIQARLEILPARADGPRADHRFPTRRFRR